jgi:hypothetical protein
MKTELPSENSLPNWPEKPERANAGRYGNVQWMYAEYVGDYDYIGRKYELDRAEAALARLRIATRALYEIGHGSVQESEAIAYAAGILATVGDVPDER